MIDHVLAPDELIVTVLAIVPIFRIEAQDIDITGFMDKLSISDINSNMRNAFSAIFPNTAEKDQVAGFQFIDLVFALGDGLSDKYLL
jgi:hypothetical protein